MAIVVRGKAARVVWQKISRAIEHFNDDAQFSKFGNP